MSAGSSPSSATSSTASIGISSSPLPCPPFPAYLTGRRVLIWDLPVASVLRQQHRIVGECRSIIVQPARRNGGEQSAAEEDENDAAAAYTSAPVHYSLHQAHWLLSHGLITLLDGTDVNALRRARFHRSDDNGSRDARVLSLEERRLYLMRYMDEANKHKQSKRAAQHGQQPSTAPSAAEPTATPSPPPVAPVTAYPPFSTHALAEALLTESSSSLPRVPLSSLPAMIVSHCSPPQSMLSSSSKDSSALLRLRSMCSEPSAALLCRAFADLHSRGSVVTAGQQYGGELLLYADEPSSCHAHSIVSVRSAARSSVDGPAISALDLLIVARIASAVSKGVVLAYEAEGKEGLAYLTLHWHPALSAAT